MENNIVKPIMVQAAQDFLNRNRDLVACVRGGAREIVECIEAEMTVGEDVEAAEITVNNLYSELSDEDSDEAGSALTSSNDLVRIYARGTMQHEFYKQLCLSFLRLTASGTLTYAIALTPEAEEQKYQIGVDAGCIRPHTIERQVQAQTAAESLDAEIVADWNGRLTTAAIRAKQASNPQYNARLNQLLNENKL